jgi:hypothetical protein
MMVAFIAECAFLRVVPVICGAFEFVMISFLAFGALFGCVRVVGG